MRVGESVTTCCRVFLVPYEPRHRHVHPPQVDVATEALLAVYPLGEEFDLLLPLLRMGVTLAGLLLLSLAIRFSGAQFNRNIFGLSFGLKNQLSFGLRFSTLRKCSNMCSLDMSQNQNGISIPFSSQNSSQDIFY